MQLAATTQKLQVVLAGSVTTNQLPVIAHYVDTTSTTYAGGNNVTATNNTTDVDAVAAPAASTVRKITGLTVFNADTAAATVTVKVDVSGTDSTIIKATLAVGDCLTYEDGAGWRVTDSSGNVKNAQTMPVFLASGASHSVGAVPDPGATAGTAKFLSEDATFKTPINYGIYSARPAAASGNTGMFYMATDIGVSGCLFRSTGSAWVQVGKCRLAQITANLTLTDNTDTSAFSGTIIGALTLPNGCLAAGSKFPYFIVGVGTVSGTSTVTHTSYIGSTKVADDGGALEVVSGWGSVPYYFAGDIMVRSVGASGKALPYLSTKHNADPGNQWENAAPATTETTVDTTGTISPDVKIKSVKATGGAVLVLTNGYIDAEGLA